jgi:hypothetical protein
MASARRKLWCDRSPRGTRQTRHPRHLPIAGQTTLRSPRSGSARAHHRRACNAWQEIVHGESTPKAQVIACFAWGNCVRRIARPVAGIFRDVLALERHGFAPSSDRDRTPRSGRLMPMLACLLARAVDHAPITATERFSTPTCARRLRHAAASVLECFERAFGKVLVVREARTGCHQRRKLRSPMVCNSC